VGKVRTGDENMMNAVETTYTPRPKRLEAAGYRGNKWWIVRHPEKVSVMVKAPDRISAVCEAAAFWGEDLRKAEWREDVTVVPA
jgi:hypothetical protein